MAGRIITKGVGYKMMKDNMDELLRCDRFAISVAFITRGGITPLLQTLKELEKREKIIFAIQRGYGEFKSGWEFPGGKIEEGETPREALKREIMEELDTDIMVGDLIDTIEYDYPNFHLSMDCFWAEIVSGDLVLKEYEATKWLTKEELDSVDWLPADITLIDKIREDL